jgi:competence protein CoiA
LAAFFYFLEDFAGSCRIILILFKEVLLLLTAKTKSGSKICLGNNLRKDTLLDLRRTEEFICPVCGEEVILKLGDQRVYHFAHKSGKVCSDEFEGESDYHLEGKLQLYQWLTRQKINAELEYYDQEIRQRPDIMFYYNGQKFALEYQCSPITEQVFVKRTTTYLAAGYIPIWILGGNQLQVKGINTLILSNFHYLFIRQSLDGCLYIPAYCSKRHAFQLVESIHAYSVKNAITQNLSGPLNQFRITELLEPPQAGAINIDKWTREIEHYHWNWSMHPGPQNRHFLQEIYNHHLNPFLLPPEIGLPCQHSIAIQTPPMIWQTYFWIDILLAKNPGAVFSQFEAEAKFQRRIKRREIVTRKLPLLANNNPVMAVYDYLNLLEKLGIVVSTGTHYYQLQCELTIPMTNREMDEVKRNFRQKNHVLLSNPLGKWTY